MWPRCYLLTVPSIKVIRTRTSVSTYSLLWGTRTDASKPCRDISKQFRLFPYPVLLRRNDLEVLTFRVSCVNLF